MAATRRGVQPVDLWAEVRAAFRKTPIIEAHIHADDAHIDGCTDGKTVTINPAPSTVETILHEFVHITHPTWCESYVTRRSRATLARLSDEEVQLFYWEYRHRRRRQRETVEIIERPVVTATS